METRLFLGLASMLVIAAVGACSSGASSSSSGSSGASSSSGSSGASSSSGSSGTSSGQCDATCSSTASITIDVSNTSNQLVGADIVACRNSACGRGVLETSDAGPGYTVTLTPDDDGGGVTPGAYVNVSTTDPSSLRIDFAWDTLTSPVDGDTYAITITPSAGGAAIFSQTFTATYQTINVCGTTCDQYSVSP